MPDPLVLFQTSDWHAGSPLTGHRLAWPAELREVRREEVDGAAERAVNAARDAGADALLVPGDLWEAENAPPSSIHRIVEALASFAPRPVFIAPGNHDYAGPGGYYDPSVLAALGMRAWPENVVVFRSDRWEHFPVPGRPDTVVVGRAFHPSPGEEIRPLASPPPRPDTPYSVLLLHGSLDSYAGPDLPVGKKRVAPFTREELLAAGFSWTALGHHHNLHTVDDDLGVVRAAYSGCPTGRGLDETGPRFFLKVTLDGAERTEVELVPSDARTIRDLSLDATDLDGRELAERALALLAAEGVQAVDVVRLTLTGVLAYGARPAALQPVVAPSVAHAVLRDSTTRPAAPGAAGRESAESRFTASLLARREGAVEDERRVLDLALRLGRDALAGRALTPPDPEDA